VGQRIEVDIVAQESHELATTPVFQSVSEASGRTLDGIELKTESWSVRSS
jgi:hypothetical protein